jgi:hypothetical protein
VRARKRVDYSDYSILNMPRHQELKWEEPKEEALRKFLVERMGFNPDRVTTGIVKLQTAHRKKSQKRMDR